MLLWMVQHKRHRLKFLWTDRRRVVAFKSSLVFETENFVDGKRDTVHTRRPLLYRADMDGVEVTPELLKAAEHTGKVYQDANDLCEIREKSGQVDVQVEWYGLPDMVDRTWEPLQQVSKDLLDMSREYLTSAQKRSLKEKAYALCFSE